MKNKILLQIGSAGILVIIGSLASFASNILLGRTLSQEDFGVFSLFRSVMFLLPVLAFLGYGNAMIRFAKENDFSTTNWKPSLQKINILGAGIMFIAAIVVQRIYPFSFVQSIFLGIAAWMFARVMNTNSILRINGKMVLGQFTILVWRYVFFITLLVTLTWYEISIEKVLILFFLSFALMFVVAKIIENRISVGSKIVSLKEIYRYGSTFFLINIFSILMIQLDKLIISLNQGSVAVGIYVGVSLIALTVFNLAGTTIGYVLMPHFANGNKIILREFLLYFLLIPLTLLTVSLFWLEAINTFIFDYKYSGNTHLLYLSVGIGIMQYYHNIIEFSLGGLSAESTLKTYLWSILISIILLIFCSVYFAESYNLNGIVFGCLIAWIVKNIIGMILLGNIFHQRKIIIFS